MKLNNKTALTISPRPPFHFDGTFHKPSHFPNNLAMDQWQPEKYWQTLWLDKKLYGLKVVNIGTGGRPKLLASIYSKKPLSKNELQELKKEIAWRFELDRDLTEFNRLAKKDRRFYPVFKKWLGMRNASQYTLYELLIVAITLQNATVRRSQQMLDALLAKFGTKVQFDDKTLWAIWLPEKLNKISEKSLRALKIGYRAKFIKKLSADFAKNKVDENALRHLSTEGAKQELIKLYGVGPETARILLFEVFHQINTFDHIAPWQQKIYSRLFYGKKLVPVKKIQRDIIKKYGQYSMLAVHYIWEDIFWRRKNEHIDWLEKEIRL